MDDGIEFEFLGKGAHSYVYRVRFAGDTSVVLKVTNDRASIEYTILQMLAKRGVKRIPVCVRHWNSKGFSYLAFVDTRSTSLRKLLYSGDAEIDVRKVFKQIVHTVYTAAKHCNVYHCNLKPLNVIVEDDMRVTVIDATPKRKTQ